MVAHNCTSNRSFRLHSGNESGQLSLVSIPMLNAVNRASNSRHVSSVRGPKVVGQYAASFSVVSVS